MAWTTPKTWTSEPLTALDLNTYVRDNQTHLKDRIDSSANAIIAGKSVLSTTSTAWVDVDASALSLTLTTHGGDILVGFNGAISHSRDNAVSHYNLAVDGAEYFADHGITRYQNPQSQGSNRYVPICFVVLITGLSAGSHAIKLRWKTKSPNTVSLDIVQTHPQFWAKEL